MAAWSVTSQKIVRRPHGRHKPHFLGLARDRGTGRGRRYAGQDRSALAAAALAAAEEVGIPAVADHNAPYAVGSGPLPVNAVAGRRMSTALTHLEPARGRANLSVRGGATVARVLVRDGRARGVQIGEDRVVAGEVVLCAGSYHTPGLLERSGVELPGLGENLSDHLAVSVEVPYAGPAGDLQLLAVGPCVTAAGPPAFLVGAALLKPRSRGHVHGNDIDLGYLTHPDDLPRLLEGVGWVERLVAAAPLRALSAAPAARPYPPGKAGLAAWVAAECWTYHHPVGTCAMGRVVDERCRVHGISGLSVIDASVMPEVPSANTHIPTIMLAEQAVAPRAGARSGSA